MEYKYTYDEMLDMLSWLVRGSVERGDVKNDVLNWLAGMAACEEGEEAWGD